MSREAAIEAYIARSRRRIEAALMVHPGAPLHALLALGETMLRCLADDAPSEENLSTGEPERHEDVDPATLAAEAQTEAPKAEEAKAEPSDPDPKIEAPGTVAAPGAV